MLDAGCFLFFLAFACALAWPVFTGKVPVATDTLALWGPQAVTNPAPAHNSVLADSALQSLPWQVFVRRSLAGGEWPLWDPDLFAGYPFLGNDQNQLYYPLAWLLWLLPLPAALQLNPILHVWLAGAGMYALARLLGTGRAGSLLAGLAFAGSGMLYMGLELPGASNTYVWLPWVLAAAEMALRRRSWAWTAGAGILFGVLAVAGHVQWLIYSALFLAMWLGARIGGEAWYAWRTRDSGALRAVRSQAARAGAILAWGPALGAVHLLPVAEMLTLSSRAAEGLLPGPATLDAVPRALARQLHIFVPQIFGTSVGDVGRPLLLSNCWYVGLAGLALGFAALLLRREWWVYLLGAGALTFFFIGSNVPFFNAVNQLPGMRALVASRAGYLFIVCAALLCGLGFDALMSCARRRPGAAAALGIFVALLGAGVAKLLLDQYAGSVGDARLYALQAGALRQAAIVALLLALWWGAVVALRGGRLAGGRVALSALLVGIILFDLLTYAPGYNTYVPPETLQPRSRVADLMREDREMWRIIAPDAPNPTFVPNMATLYGLRDVQGYSSLHLRRYEEFWAAAEPALSEGGYFQVIFRPQSYLSAQANLLNVKYVTTFAPLSTGADLPSSLQRIYEEGPGLYANRSALPRAFVVERAMVAQAATVPRLISEEGFEPTEVVLIEEQPPEGFAATFTRGAPVGVAEITRYRNLSVDLDVRMDRPGWLVLGDVNYPGWRVEVDGREERIFTAYYILRAVPLSEGTHRVRFYFLPGSVVAGGIISVGALLAALGVLMGVYVRKAKNHGARG